MLHFFVLGAVVLGLYRWVEPPALDNRIELTERAIAGLRHEHIRRTGMAPTAAEETALIRRHVDAEVLYREALALGLDRDDIIVRRRLIQKMEFLSEDLEPVPEPDDAELQAYMEAHAGRYEVPARTSLVQVFVSRDTHGERSDAVARQLRERLSAGADPTALGDPFLRGSEFALHTEQELAAVFGSAFAGQAMSLPAGVWSQPVPSSYGLHIVRVSEHRAGRRPSLAEVRATVRRDWREDRREEINRAALDRLRARYEIVVDGGPAARSGDGR